MTLRIATLAACLWCASCNRYAEFTLPSVTGDSVLRAFRFDLQAEPVLSRGAPGEWDAVDALNPAIARRGGLYYNCYSGFDGKTWHTGLAVSSNGLVWRKLGRVLSPGSSGWEGDYIAANGALLDAGGEFLYWYQAGARNAPRIGLARSRDARNWNKHGQPVLESGPRGSWDERAVADPYVIRRGEYFYLFYLGQDRARRQRLGLARSRDGVAWTRLRSNPVLEPGPPGSFDENGLGEPAVWASKGFYWMLYTGRDRQELRRLGMARSRDGVRWRKLAPVFSGSAGWNSHVLCDPEVEPRGETVRVWFGGGNRASPDENLNGQIGVGWLAGATLEK